MQPSSRTILVGALAFGLAACGDSSVSDNTGSNDSGTAATFPAGLAVTSPLARDATPGAALTRAVSGLGASSDYSAALDRINGVLDGSLSPGTALAPDDFLARPILADCFGPTLAYENHPDGSPANGTLPSGDLGLWQDSDSGGNACAAAQLDAQMNGVSRRSDQALLGLASMINVADANGVALPAAGAAVNLTSQMNALGIANTSFTNASLSLDGGGTIWRYSLSFSYVDGASVSHDMLVTLAHAPGADADHYEGVLTYRVDDQFNGGHCPSQDVSYNGSVYYQRSAANQLQLNARDGMYCGHGRAAAKITDTDLDASGTYQVIDPAETYNVSSGAGWANNFSILGAVFNPDNLDGDYTYAWQAGYGDSNSRILSVGVNGATADGEAYYGYGAPVGGSDGTIQGFFCSWAGPGSTHTLQNYAQLQFREYNASSGKFEVPTGGSDIIYAPTNSCLYEGTPANFWYDRDLDGTNNEADTDVHVYTGAPSGYLSLDLMAAIDADGDTVATVAEKLASRGFNQPPM